MDRAQVSGGKDQKTGIGFGDPRADESNRVIIPWKVATGNEKDADIAVDTYASNL